MITVLDKIKIYLGLKYRCDVCPACWDDTCSCLGDGDCGCLIMPKRDLPERCFLPIFVVIPWYAVVTHMEARAEKKWWAKRLRELELEFAGTHEEEYNELQR